MARVTIFLLPKGKRAHPVVAYWPPARASSAGKQDTSPAVHSMDISASTAEFMDGIRFSGFEGSTSVKVVIESLVANAYNMGVEHRSKSKPRTRVRK